MWSPQIHSDRAKAIWRHCLASAFRTALACTIVGGATLYGPKSFTRHVAFPAFSYVTGILIVTDATLGHTFRCCWLALLATVQGVCPAILSLWLIGPARLTAGTTAAVVAISGFVVALLENNHLITKRIALGQIVIVYVIGFINGEKTEPIMHPVHVAASTAVGVVACVLALLFPYPSLAFCEVKENCRLYIENASERLNLCIKSFCSEEITLRKAVVSQTKSLNITGRKLLHSIKSKQESMYWETLPIKFFKSYDENPGEKFQYLETVLSGLQIALENCSDAPFILLNPELENNLTVMKEEFFKQLKSMALEKTILPHLDYKFLQTLQTKNIQITINDFPLMFFLFCLKLLQAKSPDVISAKNESERKKDKFFTKLSSYYNSIFNVWRLIPAVKCLLSLGFSVLFGLIYSKENGYWSGLPVAISFASSREATFKVANIKAQGTVLGTVYGVFGCFIFEKIVKIRFVSLVPWFIFCSFLRQSKMYGQAGGISAVIGAVLILGRKNFGTPSDFAIARTIETFIGLSCSIMVDILLQPVRASVLAKTQLSMSFQVLNESVGSLSLESWDKLMSLEEGLKKLKFHVNELGKFIEEADVEPNFWFLPFHSTCYSKLRGSLSKMIDLLLFGKYTIRFLEKESTNMDGKIFVKLESDLKIFKDEICSRMKCLEKISLVKSLVMLEREFAQRKNTLDLEMGKSGIRRSGSSDEDDEVDKIMNYFLQHLEEVVGVEENEDGMLSLCGLVFCMNELLRETKMIEKVIKELVQWENPSSQVDLHYISFRIHALEKM